MTTIVTREVGDTAKGVPLSNAEVDNNFINLNNDKSEKYTQVKNYDTVTLTPGTVIIITGSNGSNVTVQRASAASESTSSKTFAIVVDTIGVNATGRCVKNDFIDNLDTLALTEGAALWLSTVAGQITTTMPTAPNHAVFLGYCVRSHQSVGRILVKIQNGYELNELHDVLITAKANGDTILYDGTTGVWKNVTPSAQRANLNIDNVENKSSSSIRDELTDLNVTTALGYIPVNKAGDILTGSLKEAKVALSGTDIDLDIGNYFTATVSGPIAFSVLNTPAPDAVASFILDLTNGGVATITWWPDVKWAGGTAPTLTVSGRDVLGFFTHDGGITWTGLVLSKDVK